MVKVFGWQLWAKKQKQTKIVLMRVPHKTEHTTCINTTYLEGLLSRDLYRKILYSSFFDSDAEATFGFMVAWTLVAQCYSQSLDNQSKCSYPRGYKPSTAKLQQGNANMLSNHVDLSNAFHNPWLSWELSCLAKLSLEVSLHLLSLCLC